MPNLIRDLTGRKKFKLTAIKVVSKTPRVQWLCECDCGNTTVINGNNFGRTKSCGCVARIFSREEANARTVFYDYRNRAKRKKIQFELTFVEFNGLIIQDCFYCGSPKNNLKTRGNGETLLYTGIDRIDPEKGYEKENVRPCCKICNTMKMRLTHEQFVSHLELIARHRAKTWKS